MRLDPSHALLAAHLFEYIAVAVLAMTGALVAARKEMDIFGFILLGTVTGVGGGTLRDLLLGLPVFWVAEPTYIAVCALASAAIFFSAHFLSKSEHLLVRLDAFGLAAFTVRGVQKALEADAGLLVAIIMGVITATFGGIIRDILSAEVPLILRREIYVTAAFAGALLFVTLALAGMAGITAASAAFLATLAIRLLAVQYNWSLPVYRTDKKAN